MGTKVRIDKELEIYYEDYDKGDVIIFIPGLTCTTEFFVNNLEALAEKKIVSFLTTLAARVIPAPANQETILLSAAAISLHLSMRWN
jgi:hypothetical protein